jgi:hypothetical protein
MELTPRHGHHPKEIGVPELLGRLGITVLELSDPDPTRESELMESRLTEDSSPSINEGMMPQDSRRSHAVWAVIGSVARAPQKNVRQSTTFVEGYPEAMIGERCVVCQALGSGWTHPSNLGAQSGRVLRNMRLEGSPGHLSTSWVLVPSRRPFEFRSLNRRHRLAGAYRLASGESIHDGANACDCSGRLAARPSFWA